MLRKQNKKKILGNIIHGKNAEWKRFYQFEDKTATEKEIS